MRRKDRKSRKMNVNFPGMQNTHTHTQNTTML